MNKNLWILLGEVFAPSLDFYVTGVRSDNLKRQIKPIILPGY
nr:MAG TPA: hypothetical protein [Caudoviricetes sp.]